MQKNDHFFSKNLHFSCISAFYFVSLQGQRLSNVGKR